MKRVAYAVGLLVAIACLVGLHHAFAQVEPPVEADIVLAGATVYDGTGAAGKVMDIAIKDDRIVAIASSRSRESRASSAAMGLFSVRASSICIPTATTPFKRRKPMRI
jgi:hypothetical protein